MEVKDDTTVLRMCNGLSNDLLLYTVYMYVPNRPRRTRPGNRDSTHQTRVRVSLAVPKMRVARRAG